MGRRGYGGSSPRLLRSYQGTAWTAGRRRCDRTQDRGFGLALAHQQRGLRLRSAGAPPGQAAADGDQSWIAVKAWRQHAGASKGLQHQVHARYRACLRRTGRGGLRSIYRCMERAAEKEASGPQATRCASAADEERQSRRCGGNSIFFPALGHADARATESLAHTSLSSTAPNQRRVRDPDSISLPPCSRPSMTSLAAAPSGAVIDRRCARWPARLRSGRKNVLRRGRTKELRRAGRAVRGPHSCSNQRTG